MTGVQTCCSSDLLFAAAPPLFIFTNSRCGSAPALYTAQFSLRQRPAFQSAHFSLRQRPTFYTAHFLLRQRPRILYCPFLVAAASSLFILTNSSAAADRKSTRLNSSHTVISYAVFCLKKKKTHNTPLYSFLHTALHLSLPHSPP